MKKVTLPAWQLALAAATLMIALNNRVLFGHLLANLDLLSFDGVSFLVTIVLLMLSVLLVPLLLFGAGPVLKPLIAVFFVGAAVLGYFANEMGVVFDEGMLLNIGDTVREGNIAEATELVSLPMLMYVAVRGVLPASLLFFVTVASRPIVRELGVRAVAVGLTFVLLTGAALSNYKYVSYFAVEHRDLRFMVIPAFPLLSLAKIARDAARSERPFRVIDADAMQARHGAKRSVGIMVVGETARADRFSLGGYGRNTNPLLAAEDHVLYAHGTSCGTSTLFSVPCMFSLRGRHDYSTTLAQHESNVLDVLQSAGVHIVWIDNNSSCKGVCDRVESVNLKRQADPASELFSDAGYYDEVLLQQVDRYLEEDGADVLLVLHVMGSHGPAYSRRYPERFAYFTPYCHSKSPKECSDAEVSNAYDNTIVYTDYLLEQLIEKLRSHAAEIDGFLFYASDHGESLGESGVYLHGLPYDLAPAAQTDIPFILWLSPGFQASHRIADRVVQTIGSHSLSHDNISHTLLGLYDVQAHAYRPELDILPDNVSLISKTGATTSSQN